jgi:hypothetical protein
MEEKAQKKTKLAKSEIFWIVLEGTAAFVGLFLIILGIVGDHLPVKYEYNWILQSENGWMKTSGSQITFRWFGFFFLLGAAVLSLFTLNHYAKKTDLDEERSLRRAQRLQVLSESPAPETKVVEATSTEVKDEKK